MFPSSWRMILPVFVLSLLLPTKAVGEVWITQAEIMERPTSGAAWTAMKAAADASMSSPNVANQDDPTNVRVLAAALVYARTGNEVYRAKAKVAILAAIGTESGSRALALGREVGAYVIAADLIGGLDADEPRFRAWIRSLLKYPTVSGPASLVEAHEKRPNNWGNVAGGARAAIAAYLGDRAEMDRTALVLRGWLGDRAAYAGFSWGDLWWQCDRTKPVGINPSPCVRDGHDFGGAVPDDARRGSNSWPISGAGIGYTWEALSGIVVAAEILYRNGYPDAYDWSDRAILRAFQFMERQGIKTSGDDSAWMPWIINARYGAGLITATVPTKPGKNMAWSDWTHAGGIAPPPPPPPPPADSDTVMTPPPPPAVVDTTLSPITPGMPAGTVAAIVAAIVAALAGLIAWLKRRVA